MAFKELDEVWVRSSNGEEYPGFVDYVLPDGNLIVRLQGFLRGEPIYVEAKVEEVRFYGADGGI
jgi:hypothetical protein